MFPIDFRYVLDHVWWKKLVEASRNGYPDDVPVLNNSTISMTKKGKFYLKWGLHESVDYDTVPMKAFEFILSSYAVENKNRDIIEREVVAKPGGKPYIEIYPRHVTFVSSRDLSHKKVVDLTPTDTMETLRDKALAELELAAYPTDQLRFYIQHSDRMELIDLSQNLDNYFDTAQEVIVDSIQNGRWFYQDSQQPLFGNPVGPPTNFTSPFNGLGSSSSRSAYHSYVQGACGLQNLGNTCFMASALQCLSNVPPLTEYFLSDAYLKDINESNPLGAHGELAKAYGELMKQMWSGEITSFVPRRMKSIIGQFAPRFNGYQQQDAQELMAFLLDGLHEDLNRVKVKPYSEEDENIDKLSEIEKAEQAWASYKARNDSIVVDKVHGQLKSTLICPVCSKVSIKFDPFCYLSVPLPPKETSLKQRIVVMHPMQPERRWAKFMITMTRSTVVEDVLPMILDSIRPKPPPETDPYMVFFAVPLGSDDIKVLTADAVVSAANTDIGSREVYAAIVQHDPETATTVIIKNQNNVGRSLSLPLIFTVADPSVVTKKFLEDSAKKATERIFIDDKKKNGPQNAQVTTQQSTEPMDVDQPGAAASLNQSTDEAKEDDGAPYKILIKSIQIDGAQSELIPFHDEVIAQETKKALEAAAAAGNPGHPLAAKTINIVFQWKEKHKFNTYRGNDLIDREINLPIRKDISLIECIDLFTRREQLGEEDSWFCPQCKKHERATKKLDLWKLPEILIVHLKRFQYSRFSRDKIDMNVSIPVKNFHLNDRVANEKHEPVAYSLIAISNHMGGLGGGHYTATALNKTMGKWYDFNDSTATKAPAPQDPLVDRLPYILVYRRQPKTGSNPALSAATDTNIEMEETEE
ncbi:hypothetical protein WR25_15949 isoform A [Diploscapter pachys]|uniref:Ubiquitin carboxyl-terminal hydrolase n=1 Tax=Diploscapter pachys TaxID=2018661 RepID=A0A2A2LBN3_9BILA|nr:hypothetical protein WR25_15949 isoform A [Diploscapter pachys]